MNDNVSYAIKDFLMRLCKSTLKFSPVVDKDFCWFLTQASYLYWKTTTNPLKLCSSVLTNISY